MAARIVECDHVIVCDCGIDRTRSFECQTLTEMHVSFKGVLKWLEEETFCETCNSNWRIYRKVGEE